MIKILAGVGDICRGACFNYLQRFSKKKKLSTTTLRSKTTSDSSWEVTKRDNALLNSTVAVQILKIEKRCVNARYIGANRPFLGGRWAPHLFRAPFNGRKTKEAPPSIFNCRTSRKRRRHEWIQQQVTNDLSFWKNSPLPLEEKFCLPEKAINGIWQAP